MLTSCRHREHVHKRCWHPFWDDKSSCLKHQTPFLQLPGRETSSSLCGISPFLGSGEASPHLSSDKMEQRDMKNDCLYIYKLWKIVETQKKSCVEKDNNARSIIDPAKINVKKTSKNESSFTENIILVSRKSICTIARFKKWNLQVLRKNTFALNLLALPTQKQLIQSWNFSKKTQETWTCDTFRANSWRETWICITWKSGNLNPQRHYLGVEWRTRHTSSAPIKKREKPPNQLSKWTQSWNFQPRHPKIGVAGPHGRFQGATIFEIQPSSLRFRFQQAKLVCNTA